MTERKGLRGIVAFRAEEFCFVHQRLRILDRLAGLTAIRLISNKYFHSSQIAMYSLTVKWRIFRCTPIVMDGGMTSGHLASPKTVIHFGVSDLAEVEVTYKDAVERY